MMTNDAATKSEQKIIASTAHTSGAIENEAFEVRCNRAVETLTQMIQIKDQFTELLKNEKAEIDVERARREDACVDESDDEVNSYR